MLLVAACGRISFDPVGATSGDGSIGDGAAPTPSVTNTVRGSNFNMSSLTWPVDLGQYPADLLLVSVNIGSDCTMDPSVPTISSVTFGGMTLTQLIQISGTPCNVNATRSALWMLFAPPQARLDVAVTLSGNARSLLTSSIAIDGVTATGGVRDVQADSGNLASQSVVITSAPGDLVISVVGHGDVINTPAFGQMQLYLSNITSGLTLANTGASAALGQSPAVTMGWVFNAPDETQIIAASIRPQ